MIDSLQSLGVLSLLALAAFGLGRPLLRGLGVARGDRLETAVWSLALGLLAGGLLLMAVGLCGGLYAAAIRAATFIAGGWGLVELLRSRRSGPADDAEPLEAAGVAPPPRWLRGTALALAGAAAAFALLSALAPATAGDALCYHLQLPKTYLAEHALVHLPDDDNSTFPLLAEMWFLWTLAVAGAGVDGGVAAQLVHWGLGVLWALAAVLLARPLLGRRWAPLVGCLVLLTPGATNQMTAPLNDAALAAWTTLALAAWWRAAVLQEDRRWYVLAGLAAGGALGTKYVALLLAAAVAVAWALLWLKSRGRRRELLVGAATVAVVATSVAGTWYLRAAWHRGNPVYPFFADALGGKGPDAHRASKTPLAFNAVDIATAPWQVTMGPERFGGRGHQLGALLLVALPGLIAARRLRGLALLLAAAVVYLVLWYALRQNVRFLYPAVPLLGVGAVWAVAELRRWPAAPRLLAAGACLGLAALGALFPLARARRHAEVALGLEARDAYLRRCEPSYRAAQFANARLPAGARVLSQEHRAFYFQAEVVRESIYRRRTGYDRQLGAPGELAAALRSAGFTHLLLAEASGPGIHYNATLSRLAAAAAKARPGSLRTLAEYEFADADGAVRRYRLMALR